MQSLSLSLRERKEQRQGKTREVSPLTMLTDELDSRRRDLRRTIRAYVASLEFELAESIAAITRYKRREDLSLERLSDIRDLTIMMRKRKLNPKGPSQTCAQTRFADLQLAVNRATRRGSK